MKFSSSLLLLLLAAAWTPHTAAQDCSTFQASYESDTVPLTLEYVVDATAGVFRGQVTYEGLGWVGFGISPTGGMVGSRVVLGLPDDDTTSVYNLGGYSQDLVTLADNQDALLGSTLSQNATHTVMQFELLLEHPTGETEFDIVAEQTNNFVLAAGSSNTLAYHQYRTPFALDLTACVAAEDAAAEDTAGNDNIFNGGMMDDTATEAPTAAPTEPANEGGMMQEDADTATEAPTAAPTEPANDGGMMQDDADTATKAPTAAPTEPANDGGMMQEDADTAVATATTNNYMVGDMIQHEGFVMDRFCIEQGFFVDLPDIPSLANPLKHTIHCLIDAPPCIASPFELLADPTMMGEDYSRAFVLDDESKAMVVELAKELGVCAGCAGTGHLRAGMRVRVDATVTAMTDSTAMGSPSGPIISISQLEPVFPFVGQGIELNSVFVSDQFCLQRGTFLDNGLPSLEQPEKHSIHCLLDVPQCISSPFEVLLPPIEDDMGMTPTTYTRGYTLDDASKEQIVDIAKNVGVCDSCNGNGTLVEGFRANLTAIIVNAVRNETSGAGPLISITVAKAADVGDAGPATMQMEMDDAEADADATAAPAAACDTSLPTTIQIDNVPMTVTYFLGTDEATGAGTFTAEVVYEGQGWVGFGISPTGGMIGSLAMIGLPDDGTVQKYNLGGFTVDQVLPSDLQTLIDSSIVQNDTHTVLTFTKLAEEPDEPAINPTGDNNFVIAAGSSNELAYHAVRQPFTMTLGCAGQDETEDDQPTATGPTAEACDTSQPTTIEVDNVPITVTYSLGTDEASGAETFSAEVVYEGQGWVGFGISPTGSMIGSLAMIGLPDDGTIQKYNLGGFTVDQVLPADLQTLIDSSCVQNDTHTVLTFTKLLEEPDEPAINPTGGNNFVVAAGSSNELAYHAVRQPFTITLGCAGDDTAPAQVATEPPADIPEDNEENEGIQTGPVNCSEFVAQHVFDGIGLTLNYVVNVDEATGEGNFSGQVIYEGLGWVGFAISEAGSMVGSLGIIGLPDEAVGASNPGKYDLGGQSVAAVTLTDQQTIINGNIEQNETHTVLTFTKLLSEPGEISIDPNGRNFFLAAAGIENGLNFHAVRGVVALTLAPCTAEGGGVGAAAEAIVVETRQGHFKAHGWMACMAWGILVPLAIGNSLCRHLIPVEGLWFEAHRALNSLAILLTIIFFAVAVNAVNSQPQPDHFQSRKDQGSIGYHKTIGLVVFILALIQGIGGVLRPHLPKKNEDGTDAEAKSAVRTMWEFVHKGSGVAILAMAWYQCHSGLVLYSQIFLAQDYTDVFWGVTGSISAIVVVGALTRFVIPPPKAASNGGTTNGVAESPKMMMSDPSHLSA